MNSEDIGRRAVDRARTAAPSISDNGAVAATGTRTVSVTAVVHEAIEEANSILQGHTMPMMVRDSIMRGVRDEAARKAECASGEQARKLEERQSSPPASDNKSGPSLPPPLGSPERVRDRSLIPDSDTRTKDLQGNGWGSSFKDPFGKSPGMQKPTKDRSFF